MERRHRGGCWEKGDDDGSGEVGVEVELVSLLEPEARGRAELMSTFKEPPLA